MNPSSTAASTSGSRSRVVPDERFYCHGCFKGFKSPEELRTHIRHGHADQSLYQRVFMKKEVVEREVEAREQCLPLCPGAGQALKEVDRARGSETSYRSALPQVDESGLPGDEARQQQQLVEGLRPLQEKKEKISQAAELAETEDESDTEDEFEVRDLRALIGKTGKRPGFLAAQEARGDKSKDVSQKLDQKSKGKAPGDYLKFK